MPFLGSVFGRAWVFVLFFRAFLTLIVILGFLLAS